MRKNLVVYTIAHTCVDAISAITVLRLAFDVPLILLAELVFLYNLLAFASQPFMGMWIDRIKYKKEAVLFSFLILLAGFSLPFSRLWQVILVGIGNSLFHTAAGADVLERSDNKMWSLGVFVSSGAIGVTLGSQYPDNIYIQLLFIILLMLVSSVLLYLPRQKIVMKKVEAVKIPFWVPAGLLFCISIRSFMGFARTAPFENIAFLPLIMTLFVFGGKFLGGFLCDKWRIDRVVCISVPLAALFYFVGEHHVILWGTGQFLINISMPITLFLLYKAMPNRPAFSFGLAAGFLFPGWLIVYLNPQSPAMITFGLVFLMNFLCLFFANKVMTKQTA